MVGKTISLFPSVFSTLLHAYEKTDFVSFIHHVHMVGSTIFAPTNHAFARLGHRVNAFLFETERGRHILKEILKYGVVANTTLYSDAVYGKVERLGGIGRSTHYDLKTLHDDKTIGVDVWRWGALTDIRINGRGRVVFSDGVAKNGVIQVVDSVPLPPCPRGGHGHNEYKEMSVEDLVERFGGLAELEGGRGMEPVEIVFEDL